MKNVVIITNATKDPDGAISKQAAAIIEKYGCKVTKVIVSNKSESAYNKISAKSVPAGTDMIFSFGGDGTFLHAAKDLINLKIPVMGINIGHLGYLTEVNMDGFDEAFRLISEDKYHIQERMVLDGAIIRDSKTIYDDIAINDIVLNRIGNMNIINFDVKVNGNFLNNYMADGYIISSPTGSTGYNLSAGGPVAHPMSEIIITTPICAHTLNSRSVIFSADVQIDVIIKSRDNEGSQKKAVSFDGDKEIILNNEDIIRVTQSEKVLYFLTLDRLSFVENIGKKMR